MRTITLQGHSWKLDPLDHFGQHNLARIVDMCGFIPSFLIGEGPLHKRINRAYSHGGGWQPFGKEEWKMTDDGILQYGDPDDFEPEYPGDEPDPPMYPIAEVTIGDETLRVYEHAWVSIHQANSDFEVARID